MFYLALFVFIVMVILSTFVLVMYKLCCMCIELWEAMVLHAIYIFRINRDIWSFWVLVYSVITVMYPLIVLCLLDGWLCISWKVLLFLCFEACFIPHTVSSFLWCDASCIIHLVSCTSLCWCLALNFLVYVPHIGRCV